MDIKKALRFASKKFSKKNLLSLSAHLDAEILLSYVLKKEKSYLHTYPEKKLNTLQKKIFLQFIRRRLKYEPVAYITREKEFYKKKFFVNKNVLIPRPETELLIDVVTKIYNEIGHKNQIIADIGTGSGCISITLKKLFPNSILIATDISSKALDVAKKNAGIHRVKINFFQGNLLEPIYNKDINILVANLPYLALKEKNYYKKILSHEPSRALYAKEKGLFWYKKLFQQIKKMPRSPQTVIIEISPEQKKSIISLSKKFIPQYSISTVKDLSGRTRIVVFKNNIYNKKAVYRHAEVS